MDIETQDVEKPFLRVIGNCFLRKKETCREKKKKEKRRTIEKTTSETLKIQKSLAIH